MAGADRRVQVNIDGNAEGIIAALQQAENAVQTQTRLISGHFSELSSSVNKVIGIIGTMSAVVAGGAAFKSFIEASQNWTGETLKLAKALGVTTEEAGAWKVAAHNLGVEQDVLENTGMKLSRTLATNQGAFDRLGIQVKDTHTGALLPMTTIIQNTAERLNEMEPGVNRNAAASLLFGRNWKDSMGILKMTAEAVAEGKRELQELGLEVGPERVQQFLRYRTEMRYIGLVSESLKVQVGNALLPVLINLGQWFHDVAPVGLFVFGGALKGVITFVEYATLGVTTLWETWKALWGQFSVTSISLVKIITQIIQGDFAGAWQTAKQGVADFGSYGVQWFDNIDAASKRTNDRVAKMWGITAQTAAKSVPQQGAHFDPNKPEKEEKDKDLSSKQIAAEDARLRAILAGFKMREQAIREGNQSLILDEEFYYKTGIISQTKFNDTKYEIERKGIFNTKALIDEEIKAIEAAEVKKLAIAKTPEERQKVSGDSKKQVTEKLAEKQQLDAQLYQLDLKAFTDSRVLAMKDEKDEFDHTNTMIGYGHQLTQAKLKEAGNQRGALDEQYAFEQQQAAAQLQWTLSHTVLTEVQKARIQDEYRAKRLLADQKQSEAATALERQGVQQQIGYTQQGLSATSNFLTGLNTLTKGKSKELQVAMKGIQMSMAIANTALGVTKALAEVPYPYDIVVAGMIAAAGAVQVATIASSDSSSSYSGGSSLGGSASGGYSSSNVVTQPVGGQTQAQGNVTVQIQGNVIGDDSWVQNNFIPALNDALGRNVTVNIPK